MKQLFILLCNLIFWINSYSTQYFVSSSAGNDANNGTSTLTPWRSLTKVNGFAFLPGDVILLMKGDIFNGFINVARSGTVGNPISYTSYGTGANPIVNGLFTVPSWSNLGGNIWESTNSVSTLSTCNMVVIGGTNTAMGRTPNTGYFTIASGVGQTQLTSSSLNSSTTNWVGAQVVQRKVAWITDRSIIRTHAGTTITFDTADNYNVQAGWGFFIEDDARTLDVQNEWYYNPTTHKIRIFSSSAPTNVQVSTVDTLVKITNRHDITFSNIAFTGSNKISFQMSALNLTIDHCQFDYAGVDAVWGGANSSPSTGFIFQFNTVNHTNNNSLLIRSNFSGAVIQNNVIKNSGIQEGMLSFVSNSNQFGMGTEIRAAGVTCQFNEVDSSGYAGIEFFGNNIIIQKNFVNGALLTLGDGGGIYTWVGEGTGTTPFTGCKILNNIVFNCLGKNEGTTFNSPPLTQGEGIYADDLSASIEIAGNTVAYCGFASYFLHNTNSMNVHDNTGYSSNRVFEYSSSDVLKPIRLTTLKNNLFVAATLTQLAAFASSSTMISNDIQQFGSAVSIDSNIYALPLADNVTIKSNINTAPNVFVLGSYNLAQWKTFSAYDVHSTKSPIAITSANQLFFAYNPTNNDSTVTLPAGSWINFKSAPFSGTTVLHGYTSIILLSSGTQTTPVINWANPAAITYGTPLSAIQLNATVTGGIPSTFTYTPAAGTILSAGSQILSVLFTPTDGTTYTTASKNVTIQVNKANATLTYSNLTQAYTGSPLQPTVTTNPAGLTVVTTTFNGTGVVPTNAGTYTVVSGLNNANYTAPTITNTFTITKATATISLSNLNQIYNGTPRPIIVTTNPSDLTGVTVTYNGSATVPTNVGSYSIVASLTNTNYNASNATGTLVIARANPVVTWANPAAITYGTLLSGTQLNASSNVGGTFTYTPASGTLLNAGTQTLSVNFTPTDAANYNSVNGTTVTLIVNKATATLSLSNLNQIYDGVGKSVTVTTTPAGLSGVSVTYNGSLLTPVNAGSYAVIATLTNANYTASPATGTLVISKATATLSISNTTFTYDGSQKSVTITTAPAGLTVVSVTYNGSPTAPTNAGSYSVIASLNNANYQATNAATTLTINKATPIVSWSNPAAITYGTALSGTQLNATANVAGTFTYTPAAGTILNAGNQTLVVDFVPTDGTNYNTVNGTTVNLVVNKATAVINVSNFNQSFDGNPKPVTVSVTPNVGVISVTYNGSATAPSAPGSYPVIVTLTNSNYTATPVNGTLLISSSSAAVTITNISQTYDGSPKSVTVTTNPPGLPVDVTYNGSATVPTVVGSYAVVATINDGGIHTGSASATLTISKANPIVSWSNPANITYGTLLSGMQLNASASVVGTFTYTPAAGTLLNAGTQILSVNFVPSDVANYNNVNGTTVTIVVDKATATLSLSNLNQAFDGTPKSVTVTSNPVGLSAIAVTYNGSNTPPSAIGSYAVSATLNNSNYTATPATGTLVISTTAAGISISNTNQVYTGGQINVTVTTNPLGLPFTVTYNGSATAPIAVGSYVVISTLSDGIHTGADTQTLVISKATPIITWPNPANIAYGTPLSGTQLNATSNIAGGFTYIPSAGSILNVGTQNLSVTFTPTDAVNYNTVNKIVPITVTGSSATLTISNTSQTYNGLVHPVIVTTNPVGLSGITVTYNGSLTVPVNAGTYAVIASLVNDNYQATPVNGTLVIAKINPSLTWNTPAAIQLGTPLSATQLNAVANIPGTFSYAPALGTVLSEGVTRVVATFTPTDSINYNSASISVPITVYGSSLILWYILHGNGVYENLPGQNIPL